MPSEITERGWVVTVRGQIFGAGWGRCPESARGMAMVLLDLDVLDEDYDCVPATRTIRTEVEDE